MRKRVRLTHRDNGRRAVDDSIQYPGNVNQPDRKFKKQDQYDNYEETINHPIPDMRHEWNDNPRDEIGFGIPEPWGKNPTVASVRVAANKSIKLAYLLLGEKVPESVIEAQANDFMLLGPNALDRSISRFAKTQKLYADDDADDDDDDDDDEEEETVTAATEKEEKAEEKAAETIQQEKEDAAKKKSSKKNAAEDEEVEEEVVEASKSVKAEEEDEVEEVEVKASKSVKAEEDEEVEEEVVEASKKGSSDMDIELSGSMDDGLPEGEVDPRLAGLFDDDIPMELPEPGTGRRESSSKKGIKSLGGQPRVASDGGDVADISNIWKSAPDVSQIFR